MIQPRLRTASLMLDYTTKLLASRANRSSGYAQTGPFLTMDCEPVNIAISANLTVPISGPPLDGATSYGNRDAFSRAIQQYAVSSPWYNVFPDYAARTIMSSTASNAEVISGNFLRDSLISPLVPLTTVQELRAALIKITPLLISGSVIPTQFPGTAPLNDAPYYAPRLPLHSVAITIGMVASPLSGSSPIYQDFESVTYTLNFAPYDPSTSNMLLWMPGAVFTGVYQPGPNVLADYFTRRVDDGAITLPTNLALFATSAVPLSISTLPGGDIRLT